MLFDRQKFVLAVHQALKEHDKEKDKEKDKEIDSGRHHIAIDCDNELEQFADRILELME
jgi:acetylglutamate synthase